METNNNYRCSVCGGDMAWEPSIQKLRCPYCGETYSLQDMEEQGKTQLHEDTYERGQNAEELGYTESTDDTGVNPADLKVYKCKYCAAEIITDKNTAATTCIYCGNPVVIEEQLVNGFTPKWVIPFKVKQNEVKDKYLSFIKKKFTPNSFLTDEHIEKIKGVYVPFWLYDGIASGNLVFEGDKTSSHRSGDYRITEHRIYNIYRDGNITFSKIPADASSKIANAIMDSVEPFNYADLTKFEMPYLAGFFAEKYDEDDETCRKRIDVRMKKSFEDTLKTTINGYSSKTLKSSNVNNHINKADYAMLPIYLLYTKYNNKNYTFAMNGQTGKMIGDIPVDKKKIVFFALKWWALLSTIISFYLLFTI